MPFHHPPRLNYVGLTLIVSNPSRFDITELLSGNAGQWFSGEVMRKAGINRYQIDIYDCDSFGKLGRVFLPSTKVVLLLGERAQREIAGVDTTLGEQRGSPIIRDGIVYIS